MGDVVRTMKVTKEVTCEITVERFQGLFLGGGGGGGVVFVVDLRLCTKYLLFMNAFW